ncbi:ATP-binding protein [Bacteroides intestinalis]|uniref:histidine kinase n=1 Tax=Bacteroides intestinalis TaxID=329854 RepID=A0AB37M5K8_9BACE|nr:ATP-binding protein [Bacteroides intestinalis]MCB6677140.1 molecular chaperone Hsp90 [Bacteroides intestinalis]MCB7014660.1 molecular chaperone Hsp90 [Bacteroides intestinalis]MCG4701891.1 ATP-binding protein [Bacteroides intestinalis]MCG4717699.1 ATP-binding protein [Bacteroides intestinalis]MCG4736803.1 ATP-binding protein [Bacteroides intestinalis]
MLFYSTSYIQSANLDLVDERIHLMEYLMDNNLAYSQEVRLHDIAQWEDELVDVFRNKKDYKHMFLMQQMAAYALVSDGHINEALEKANAMLQQATLMKYDIGIAISHYAIGDTYLNANMTNEAIEEYEIAMQKLYKIADSEKLQEKVLIQLIPTLIRLGRLNEAKDYLEQIEQVKDYRHSRFIENIFQAYYYLHTNNLEQAREYIQEAEEWYEYYPFFFHSSILKYIQAEYAKQVEDDEQAIKLYNELTVSTSSANVYNRYLKMKNSLARLYTKRGRAKEACEIFQDINAARDSINARNYSSQINLLRTIYQVDRLEMDNQNERNRLLFYSIMGCILILSISIASVLYIRKINKRLIASRLKLEKARQIAENSIRTKSVFLSNMSHEIRTPLNALSGFSAILTDANIDISTRQQCNEIIQQNSDLLLKLIDDVVDLSSLEIGKMQFLFANNNAVAICRNVVDTVEKIKQTSASVLFQTSLENLEIYTDEARLQQLLINLLINATKFTTEGSITLSLEKQSEEVALFAVSDTGCGIAPEKQGAIFNRFEKLNENAQGSGLGLSICQLIVERFGGKIWIDPEYKNGSRFLFTHPIVSTSRKEVSE